MQFSCSKSSILWCKNKPVNDVGDADLVHYTTGIYKAPKEYLSECIWAQFETYIYIYIYKMERFFFLHITIAIFISGQFFPNRCVDLPDGVWLHGQYMYIYSNGIVDQKHVCLTFRGRKNKQTLGEKPPREWFIESTRLRSD